MQAGPSSVGRDAGQERLRTGGGQSRRVSVQAVWRGPRCEIGRLRGAGWATMVAMRYRRAVEKLQTLAEACEAVKGWPPEDPFLLEAWAFGDVLRGADPLECVEVVIVVNLPPQEVVWGPARRARSGWPTGSG